MPTCDGRFQATLYMSWCGLHLNKLAKHRKLKKKKGVYWRHVVILPESKKKLNNHAFKGRGTVTTIKFQVA